MSNITTDTLFSLRKATKGGNVQRVPANSATCLENSVIGFRPSTGYAVRWTATAGDIFIGFATKAVTSGTEFEVSDELCGKIICGTTNEDGLPVAGLTAQTLCPALVYLNSTDNISADLTITPTGPAIGRAVKCVSSGYGWVEFFESGLSASMSLAGIVDIDGTVDQDIALTGTGDANNITATMSHATQTAEGLDVSIAQITNARTSGEIIGVKSSVTSLTGSTAGTDHSAFYAAVTVGAAGADHFALKQGAGFDATIDASGCATTEAAIQIPDNVAAAFEIREATTSYLTVVSTDSSESIASKVKLTTTNGVASGDAARVGGILYVQTAASTAITGTASETLFDTSAYLIPANTLKAGSMLRVYFQATATATNANDTLTVKLVLGGTAVNTTGTAILTTALPDATNGDIICGWFILTPRAAPGATAACVGYGYQSNGVIGTIASLPVLLASTNFATNGALGIKLTGTWSSNSGSNSCRSDVFVVEVI